MTANLDDLLPTADQLRKKIALAEAEKAEEAFRKHAEAEAQKKAEIERLAGPSGRTEEEKIQIAAKVTQRAIASGALPEPDAWFGRSPRWLRLSIERWLKTRPKLPGRKGGGA